MTSGVISTGTPQHPLAVLVGELEALKDQYGGTPAWTVTPPELTDLLQRLGPVTNWLDSLELQLLAQADRHQVGDTVGATNTASWWAHVSRCTRPAAHRAVALATRLEDNSHQTTATAMSRGELSADQAAVILDAIEALPAELVDTFTRRQAETDLVELAAHHDPGELRILGRRILDVIAPEIGDEHERRILEDQERHAAATASFTMRPDGHGSMSGRFKIPVLAGEMLAKELAAIAAPKHRHATQGPTTPEVSADKVSRPLRLGAAFVEYLETRPATGVPKAGGIAATVVVTMTMADLLGQANKAALLDTGAFISASEARRLACEAGIIPCAQAHRADPSSGDAGALAEASASDRSASPRPRLAPAARRHVTSHTPPLRSPVRLRRVDSMGFAHAPLPPPPHPRPRQPLRPQDRQAREGHLQQAHVTSSATNSPRGVHCSHGRAGPAPRLGAPLHG